MPDEAVPTLPACHKKFQRLLAVALVVPASQAAALSDISTSLGRLAKLLDEWCYWQYYKIMNATTKKLEAMRNNPLDWRIEQLQAVARQHGID